MTTDTHDIPTTCPGCDGAVGDGVGIDGDGRCTGCGQQLADEDDGNGDDFTPSVRELPSVDEDPEGVVEVTHEVLGGGSKTVALLPGESVEILSGTDAVTVEVRDGNSD